MECEEIRVDLRTIPHSADRQRSAQLLFRLNHTLPFSEEYNALLRELLGKNLGEGSTIAPPLSGAALDMLKIGRGVFVNSNLLAMARGGITIGDHARIAANVQLLSNNHDPYDLDVLTCKPVEIGDYAWIGAGATVLPGVRVGRHHPGNAEQEEAKLPPAHAQSGYQQRGHHADKNILDVGHAATAFLVAGSSPRIASVSSISHQKVGLAGEVFGQKQPTVQSRYSEPAKHSTPIWKYRIFRAAPVCPLA